MYATNTRPLRLENYRTEIAQSTNDKHSNAPFSITQTIKTWMARAHQRAELPKRTPEQLADMGISAADLARELNKPFWKA